ncbi:MAG: cytochrome P450 [Salinisphaera sp.]|jgi:cytochrome P450|nr:cytochrome P450 [Salinisphaera sp.]
MNSCILDSAAITELLGPQQPFSIEANDHTRRMLERWQQDYGDFYQVRDTRRPDAHWVVNRPDLVHQLLVRRADHYAKGMGLDRVRILLGNGIMVSEGDFWARQRRLIQPAFKPRSLADFNAMIHAENLALAKRWQARADAGESVEAVGAISELTLVIVLKSIFGRDYAQLVAGGRNPFSLLTEEPSRNLRFAARFHRLKGVVDSIIEQRLSAADTAFDFLGHMLSVRLRNGESMSRTALVDEIMTLIVAGHETTASALAFAWYLIAADNAICRRLQQEIDTVSDDELAATGGNGPRQNSPRLPFTDRVIAETLRLYPPGWLLSRRATVGHELGGHPIAAGTQLFISPYILHRHPDYWRAPDRFDPDRFADARTPSHRMAYLPSPRGRVTA